MKKTLLLLSGVALILASCSDDSPINTSDETLITNESHPKSNARINNKLETLYNAMIVSQEYIDVEISIKNFFTKIHNSSAFDTEEDLLNWAKTNIASTEFNNYKALEEEWSGIITKQTVVLTNHHTFFTTVVEEYPDIDYGHTQIPYQTTGDCLSELNNCYFNAQRLRTYTIYSAMAISNYTGTSQAAGVSLASANYNRNKRACDTTYEACIGN